MWPAIWEAEGERIRELLEKWQGATAEAWGYTVSHGQFLLRLHRHSPKSLFVWCKDCRSVQFASSWQDSDVRLERNPGGVLLATDGENLNVSCASVHAVESEDYDVKPLFGSFKD
jgi:hypothetical protein